MNRSFKMLQGYCHVFDDRLLFAPTNDLGIFKDDPDLKRIQARMIKIRGLLYPVFIFLTLLGFYFAIVDMMTGEIISSLFFLGLGIVLLRLLMIYLLSNPTLMIKRDKIISIKYRKEITLLGIWPMFVVKFAKENGKTGTKLLVMKYTLSEYGKEVAEQAIKIFNEEGLLNS
jgi:hypothetical protein